MKVIDWQIVIDDADKINWKEYKALQRNDIIVGQDVISRFVVKNGEKVSQEEAVAILDELTTSQISQAINQFTIALQNMIGNPKNENS